MGIEIDKDIDIQVCNINIYANKYMNNQSFKAKAKKQYSHRFLSLKVRNIT